MVVGIRPGRLTMEAAYRCLDDPSSGGIAVFAGRVRADRASRGRVRALLYESDRRLAEGQLAALEARARDRFGVRKVVLWHRTGELPVGAISVIVGVAAPHRAAAFSAAQYLIDALKDQVAIWKTDRFDRGRSRRGRRAAGGRTRRRRRPRRSAVK